MMDEKLRILNTFNIAVGFVKDIGRPPETSQEVAEYITRSNNKSKRPNSEPANIDWSDYEISDEENELLNVIYKLAKKRKYSPTVSAEIFGYAISKAIQDNATDEECIKFVIDGYLDKYSCDSSGLIAELYQQTEVSHEIRKR